MVRELATITCVLVETKVGRGVGMPYKVQKGKASGVLGWWQGAAEGG